MELLSRSILKVRKNHYCNYCNGFIQVGESYERSCLKDGGGLYTWKAHLRCQAIAEKLKMFDDCDEGVTRDDFIEYIHTEYFNLQGDEIPNTLNLKFQDMLDYVCKHHKIN